MNLEKKRSFRLKAFKNIIQIDVYLWSTDITQVNEIRMFRPKQLRTQLKDQVREKLNQKEEDYEKLCDGINNLFSNREDNGFLPESDRNLMGKAKIIIIIYYVFTI